MTEQVDTTVIEKVPQLAQVMTISSVIGEGTFSTVYKGALHPHLSSPSSPKIFAVKHITQLADPSMQYNELKYLTQLGGDCNIIQVFFATRHEDNVVIVMPYLKHEKFCKLIKHFDCEDIKDYMKNLLIALKHIHSHKIIHRDIKPNNFLYSSRNEQCALVDFGLAQVEENSGRKESDTLHQAPGGDPEANLTAPSANGDTSLAFAAKSACGCVGLNKICRICLTAPAIDASRAGTAGYRPPEVLLKCRQQTTAVDMWACGVILLSLLSGRANFFNPQDDVNSLAQLISLFGKKAVVEAAKKMGKRLLVDFGAMTAPTPLSLKSVCEELRLYTWNKSLRYKNRGLLSFPDSAYDLLGKLLRLDPGERITAAQALQHTFITSTVAV